jgi:hypothetical protein
MYPLAVKDIEGRKLDGSKYSYALTAFDSAPW